MKVHSLKKLIVVSTVNSTSVSVGVDGLVGAASGSYDPENGTIAIDFNFKIRD